MFSCTERLLHLPPCRARGDGWQTQEPLPQQSQVLQRPLAVLQRNDGKLFDQNLIRRFSQLVGIYPVGNLVRLSTNEIAVVLKTYAPDPYRPRVRVLRGADGADLERPYEVNLWESAEEQPMSIQAPLNPAAYGINPLAHIQ